MPILPNEATNILTKIAPRLLLQPDCFLAFGFGSGLAPKAPGTFGTLAAFLPYIFLQQLGPIAYLICILLAFGLGVYICGLAAEKLGVHDHGGIVWDEFVGLWITLWCLPEGWYWLLIGFVLFRFFDILKPWPIAWLDKKCHGGFGIMIDDVIAGMFAWLVLQLFHFMIL